MCIRDRFLAPSAEELAFNSQGACPQCGGIGTVRTVDQMCIRDSLQGVEELGHTAFDLDLTQAAGKRGHQMCIRDRTFIGWTELDASGKEVRYTGLKAIRKRQESCV